MKRTQIYLQDEQAVELDQRAAASGTTRSRLIREAIDGYLQRPLDEDQWRERWRAAVQETAGIAPYLTPEHVDEMRAAGARKLIELDRRRLE